MPFPETAAAAAARGVLCDEYRMASHRGLFSVLGRKSGFQTEADEITGMAFHRIHSLAQDIFLVFL